MSVVEAAAPPGPTVFVQAPAIAVKATTAAAMLGMSKRHFERHVEADLRRVYSGSLVLYPVAELERWVRQTAVVVGS